MTLTDQQREIIGIVVARFLDRREATSRRSLLRKFKSISAIDELRQRGFFSVVVHEDEYLPMPLAFHNCGNAEHLLKAKQATERALYTLQNLDEAYPEKAKGGFSREDFLNHAARIYDPKPDEDDLLLGLHLSTYFGIFTHWACDSSLNAPNTFGLHEGIVTIDPSQMWDEHIKNRDQLPAALALNLPEELNLPIPRAVDPVGDYAFHPEIERVSGDLFREGNFRQAVLDAFIHLISVVKRRAALINRQGVLYDGDDLMNRAFSPDGQTPPVQFNSLLSTEERDEQRGIWNLFKGVVFLRNFKAHIVADFNDPHRAHEYLALASLLMRLLDSATFDRAVLQPQVALAQAQAAKPAKRQNLVEVYGQGAAPGPILISGSESSTQPGTTALSRLVTLVNKGQQSVRITANRLLIDGCQWPVEALFFQSLKTRAKDKAITISGNSHDDFRLYLLVSTTDLPRNQSGILEFQIDQNEEPLRVNVQFPAFA